ncbi:MAG: hypothetical protein GEV11_27815 [Streptosporangiales bacterium]|nr:hypothetical protein [Streptosporangiales bacterium]
MRRACVVIVVVAGDVVCHGPHSRFDAAAGYACVVVITAVVIPSAVVAVAAVVAVDLAVVVGFGAVVVSGAVLVFGSVVGGGGGVVGGGSGGVGGLGSRSDWVVGSGTADVAVAAVAVPATPMPATAVASRTRRRFGCMRFLSGVVRGLSACVTNLPGRHEPTVSRS